MPRQAAWISGFMISVFITLHWTCTAEDVIVPAVKKVSRSSKEQTLSRIRRQNGEILL